MTSRELVPADVGDIALQGYRRALAGETVHPRSARGKHLALVAARGYRCDCSDHRPVGETTKAFLVALIIVGIVALLLVVTLS
jgi:hypothetical protein